MIYDFMHHMFNVFLFFGFIVCSFIFGIFMSVYPIYLLTEKNEWYFSLLGFFMIFIDLVIVVSIITFKGF